MAKTIPEEEHDDELKQVALPSKAVFYVYDREVSHFKERTKRYLDDNKFVNISDLQDLDRMLMLELLVWRWTTWVSQQKDYWDQPIDESTLSRSIKDTSVELRQLKAALGIDKSSRDKARGDNSVAAYLDNLRHRAKEFGIMREEQLEIALTLVNELSARVTLYQNCTPDERRELNCNAEDVMAYITNEFMPRFNAVDQHFRHNKQRMWIRSQ